MAENETAILARKGMLVDPGDHFKGRYEVERKFRVDDLENIRSRLLDQGAVGFSIGNSETDSFFDLKDKRLAENNQFQILRQMSPSGRVLWISKGPGRDECVAMDLSDFDKARSMLLSLGYKETLQIRKQRDIYFIDEFHATLDQVAELGTFVELAVMSDNKSELPALRKRVQDMANQLGLQEYTEETSSYRQMLFG